MRCSLASVVACLMLVPFLEPAPARAQVVITDPFTVDTRPGAWKRPSRAVPVTAKTRAVKIKVDGATCRRLKRIKVTRKRRAVVITVIFEYLIPNGPYFTPCPPPTGFTRRVSLEGKLGARSVKDGATTPPSVRYQRP